MVLDVKELWIWNGVSIRVVLTKRANLEQFNRPGLTKLKLKLEKLASQSQDLHSCGPTYT